MTGVLKGVTCLQIFLFLKRRSIVYYFLFYLVTLFRVEVVFTCSLPYGSWYSSAWNLDPLLGLSWVPVSSQVPPLEHDCRWSHNRNIKNILPHKILKCSIANAIYFDWRSTILWIRSVSKQYFDDWLIHSNNRMEVL